MIRPVALGACLIAVCVAPLPGKALAQGDGHLHVQIMDVPEVDGAVLVTRGGQTVLLDNGVLNQDAKDFSGLKGIRPSIVVIDGAGKETRGQLLRFDLESLTIMTAARSELTFERQDVARVYERGDSLKNGMMIGLVTGAVIGIAAGVSGTDCGGFFEGVRSCTGGEKARLGAIGGAVFGALGLGVGAGIDALMNGRRLVYETPRPSGPTISIVPFTANSITRLSLTVAW
jgi:hypothetical protein